MMICYDACIEERRHVSALIKRGILKLKAAEGNADMERYGEETMHKSRNEA